MTNALYNLLKQSQIKSRVLCGKNTYQFCHTMHMLMHQQNSALILIGMD